MENMSLADIAAINKDNDGFFGGNGFFAIIVLFFIFAMFGGGFGGWGGNNAAAQGAITRGELYEGFNTSAILNNQNSMMRDQFGLQRDVLENRFNVQQCCCETQKEIMQSRYDAALQAQAMQAQQAQCLKRIAYAIRRFFASKNAVGTCAA